MRGARSVGWSDQIVWLNLLLRMRFAIGWRLRFFATVRVKTSATDGTGDEAAAKGVRVCRGFRGRRHRYRFVEPDFELP